MRDRICLVTGGTDGIGYETARGLAALGARVGIVGRDPARTEAAAARLRDATGAVIDAFPADLSEQSERRQLIAALHGRFARLDVLVNNAGAIFPEPTVTSDGIEKTWALDHLAYVELSLGLFDLLRAGAPARIVSVSSGSHKRGSIDGDPARIRRDFGGIGTYSRAKLGNMLFTYALARRIEKSGVSVNALHPGVVASRIASSAGGFVGLLWAMFGWGMLSSEQGARTSIHLASAPELDGVSGRYFIRCKEAPTSARSRDLALQERVWALSLRQLGLDDPFPLDHDEI